MYRDIGNKNLFVKAQEYGVQYLENVFDRSVYPESDAIKNLTVFDEDMPKSTANAFDIINTLNEFGAPATVSQIGGRYFGFVCGSAVPAGLAAKTLASYWDQNAAMNVLSPIAAKLETVVENWLNHIFNFPERTKAGFVSGTSMATFCGLAAARYRMLKRLNWDINDKGLIGAPRIRIVTGKQAHSTVLKAIGLLGFGKDNIEWVDVDAQGRIMPHIIPELDDRTIVVVQAGNVNSGSFDNFTEICTKARNASAWVHVDGAFGLWAAASKKLCHLTKGVEWANSWSVDGHKTLNTPYDCGIILCEDQEAFVAALHMTGSYIILSESRDGMFFTPEMSRRARIIELWATLKYLGKAGIDQMITGLHERAVQFSNELKDNGFEILNDVVFNQVLVSCGNNELTEKTMKHIQEERVCWVGGSKWVGKSVIRISVSSWATTKEDVSLSVRSFVMSRDKALQEINANNKGVKQ
jgi:glutamate/tyrosine decarboxylase-like PLP-dependent enzyme